MTHSNTTLTVLRAALFAAATLHAGSATTLGTAFPLYVSNRNNNMIVKLDSSGNQTVATALATINEPSGLAFDSHGVLYVGSVNGNAIYRLDASGNPNIFATGGNISGPTGIAFDAFDNLYVANLNNNTIVRVVTTGEQLLHSSGGLLQTPYALAVDAAGNVYATSSYLGGSVIKMDNLGNQTQFAPRVPLQGAQGLAFDSAGNLYVSCHNSSNTNHTVVKLDPNGNSLGTFSGNGNLSGPAGLAFDAVGNLYVASDRNNEIVRLSSSGTQAVFSSGGSFRTPFFIAFTRLPALGTTITYSGSVTGNEVNNWRLNVVPKSRDADGDNVYGSWGAVNWTRNSYLESVNWIFGGSGAQSVNPTNALINDLPTGASNTVAGIAQGSFTFVTKGTEQDYQGKTLRVGIMEDVLDPGSWGGDTFKGLQVVQVSGSGDSGVIPLRGGSAGTGSATMYFFDVYPIRPDETFTILAPANVGGTSGNAGYLSAVSFDLASVGQAQFFPSSLNFGNQQQGVTSAARIVTLSNEGSGPLAIASIAVTGNFAQTNNCGTSLAPGASCQISVTCTPVSLGALTGSLTIIDNSSGAVQLAVPLTATGLSTPTLLVSPGNLDFGNQQTYTTSAAKAVTLTNNSPGGSFPISFPSITITGNFAQTNNCPASLGAGASCQMNVTFSPQSAAALTGQIVLKDNASGAPQTISLTGTGMGTATGTFSPTSLTFGGQQQGTAGGPLTVTFSNSGTAPLLITSMTLTNATAGVFSQTNNCPATLTPAASCQFSVTFRPPSIGTFTGTINITDNNGNVIGSVQTISISGTGVGIPKVVLSTTNLTFPTTLTGQTSGAQTVTLSNTGTGPLNIQSLVLQPTNGPFTQTNTCGRTVAEGTSCQFSITFSPTFGANYTGVIQLIDNDPAGFQNINFSGTGSYFTITPASLNFGNVLPGASSAPQTVTIVTGASPLTFDSIAASGGFVQTNNCPAAGLAKNATCQINVVFKPSAAGNYNGTLTIQDQIQTPTRIAFTQTIALTGTANFATATLSSTSLVFLTGPNATSTQSVTLSNTGNIPLTISSMTMAGNNPNRFTQTNTCGTSVAPGAKCTIAITFHAPGTLFSSASAALKIVDNANPGTQSISLAGVVL